MSCAEGLVVSCRGGQGCVGVDHFCECRTVDRPQLESYVCTYFFHASVNNGHSNLVVDDTISCRCRRRPFIDTTTYSLLAARWLTVGT